MVPMRYLLLLLMAGCAFGLNLYFAGTDAAWRLMGRPDEVYPEWLFLFAMPLSFSAVLGAGSLVLFGHRLDPEGWTRHLQAWSTGLSLSGAAYAPVAFAMSLAFEHFHIGLPNLWLGVILIGGVFWILTFVLPIVQIGLTIAAVRQSLRQSA